MVKKVFDGEKNFSNVSEKAPNISKTKNININSPVSGFSLSSIALKNAANSINSQEEKQVKKPMHDFEFSTLESLWKEYSLNLKKEGKQNIASIFGVSSMKLKEANKISLIVPSEMNKVEMIRELDNLLPFLRKRLNNHSIKIEFLVSETIKKELVYSANEKYKYLKKLNPALEELRDRFHLDF